MTKTDSTTERAPGGTSGADGSPDYAYKTIEEYEETVGYKVNEAFRIGWAMARTTKAQLGILANAGGQRTAVAGTLDWPCSTGGDE